MAERKKAQKEVIPDVETKVRTEGDKPKPTTMVVDVETKSEVAPTTDYKPKKPVDKYIRIALGAPAEERKAISDRAVKGEIKLSHFADDSGVGYHYYLVIKN